MYRKATVTSRHEMLFLLLTAAAFLPLTAFAQQPQPISTTMDLEDLTSIGLPNFGNGSEQRPLAVTPEGANARFFECRVLTNSSMVPGDQTTVVGTTSTTNFGDSIQIGFGQPVNNLSFTLINGLPNNITIDGKPVTAFPFDITAMDNAFHLQTQTVTLAGNQTISVNISLPDTRFVIVNPQPFGFLHVRVSKYFLDNLNFTFLPATAAAPKFVFEYKEGQLDDRLLVHKWLDSDRTGPFAGYMSAYQVTTDVSNQPLSPTLPPLYRLPGTVTMNGASSSQMVYFRVIDPPDTALYVPNRTANDNRDVSRPKGRLVTLDQTGQRIDTTQMQSNVDGVTGRAVVYLEGSNHVAGDNYQVEASFDSAFPCATAGPSNAPDICAKSAKIVTWKRVSVEEESMFRQGSFITNWYEAGTDKIPVADLAPFSGLPSGSLLELVHANRGGEGYYADFARFSRVEVDPILGPFVVLDPSYGLPARDYGVTAASRPNPNIDVQRDGVGVVDAGLFQSEPAYVQGLFASMFVDFQPVPSLTVGEVPYVGEFEYTRSIMFANRWMQTRTAAGRPAENVFHRLAVSQFQPQQNLTTLRYGAELGVTFVGGGGNSSFILVKRIADLVAGTAMAPDGILMGLEYRGRGLGRVYGEVTTHETVHYWVNSGGSDQHGHCLEERYPNDGLHLQCLMHEPYVGDGLDDGEVSLHYVVSGGVVDSEYDEIRTAAEPVPVQ